MTKETFEKLQIGDLIRHELGGDSYVVTANYGSRVTAVRTVDMTNPSEWKLVAKVQGHEILP